MPNTIVITGASSGIGRAAAEYFSARSWNVAATMRSPEKEQQLQQLANLRLYRLDVTDSASIEQALTAIQADFGRIDVVVNNAGYGVDGVFEAMSDEVINRQFDTNVFGLMRVTRAIIPIFRQQGGGTIIQIASMGGRITFPLYSIYHGTKWAVEGFSESLAYELQPFNIRMRIVEPGSIKTEFYGQSREMVKPTDTQVYDEFVAKCEKVSMNAGANAEGPEVVAATIFKAATDQGKRLRYAVGNPAPMILLLRKLLPDTLFFRVVKGVYGIP